MTVNAESLKKGIPTSDSLGCWNSAAEDRRSHIEPPLHIHDALWTAVVSDFVVTQVMWVFRSAGGYNNPLCLIIQGIMWGRAGPEVTAAPCVKQLCAGINMQMGQKDTTGYSHVHFGNQSAIFRLRNLMIIGWSSTRWRWTGGVSALNSPQRSNRELVMKMSEPQNRISLGTNNVGRLTITYFLKQKHLSVFNFFPFASKTPVLSNRKHLLSYLHFFPLIFCSWPSVVFLITYQNPKLFPPRTVSISHFIDFHSIIESVCCCIYQLGLFKTNVFAAVPAVDRTPSFRKQLKSRGEENAQEKPTSSWKQSNNDSPSVSIETNMDSYKDDGRWWNCLYQ